MKERDPIQVVIVGGGFAGISIGIELGKLTKRDRSIDVHLVSNENYFVFQPLLPEVVSCSVEPSHILNPIRHLCPHVHFHCAGVNGIHTERNQVSIVGTDARRARALPYDHLILCPGLAMDASKVPGMAEHSLPIKTLGDAFHLRNHVLSRLEQADVEGDDEQRTRELTFVAIGGGFSGVETVAGLNDMLKDVLTFYPQARKTGYRVILIHGTERILNELDEGLATFAHQKLQERGVEIMLNTRVNEITPTGVVLSNGERIGAETVISTVGNSPHPMISKFAIPQEKGRIIVDECLRIQGAENLWAIGDSALVPDLRRGGFCPPTAQYALRQGRHCARNVLRTIRNQPVRPFEFGGLGQLAIVGRHCGVAQIFGWRIAGWIAWLMWRSVYLMKLPGIRSKVRVGLDWSLDLLFPRDITKIEVQKTEQLKRAHFQRGEHIINQGEIGDRFYIIEAGQVEIVRKEPGRPEECLAVRGEGDSFGEIALIHDVVRTATVRCLTPVDVVTFNRRDFQTLVGSYEVLRTPLRARIDKELSELTSRSDSGARGSSVEEKSSLESHKD